MVRKDRFAPSQNGAPDPANSTAEQLLAEFQQVEQVWKKAEEKLATTHVPVDVRVKVSEGPIGNEECQFGEYTNFLAYSKVKGSRRICYVTENYYYVEDQTELECRPVTECPVDVRIGMFDRFEALYREAESVRDSYVPKIREARAKFEKTLEFIDFF
jgi:hypothetical protein